MKIRLGKGFKINPPFTGDSTPIHHAGDPSTWQEPIVINATKKKK